MTPSIHLEDQVVFWNRVFGELSQPDERDPIVQGPILWDLIRTIALPELVATLRKTKKGAAGPDKVSMRDLKNIDPRALLAHFNLWLYVGYQPANFRRSRTVLIPKSANPEGPGQFRPISISSFICRVFHRLLADRLSSLLSFTSRQRAFVKGDGIADNVFLLRCLLRDKCEAVKPLSLAFLDVSKAFDSVSHESLLLAVKRMGVPGPFVEYLRSLYAEASTTLQVGDRSSDPLQQNRGVRQGDPLSPLLFNCVIDWAVASLDNEMGVRVTKDGPRLNHLAFADDVVLVAESKVGIQHLCDQFRGALRLNTEKSKTLRIAVDGKAKKWVCNPTPLVSLAGRKLPTISISQGYKYLGISVSARESDSSPEELLTRRLNHLTRAPLKPQQRVYILKQHLIPKLYHRPVLSRSNCSVLKRLDKLVRRGLRTWLRLPHDAVNSFFHTEVREGGLGVPSFRLSIPIMKSNRLERLSKSQDEAIMALVQSSACFAREKCFHPPIKVGNYIVKNSAGGDSVPPGQYRHYIAG